MNELKPCPFCGEIPFLDKNPIIGYKGYFEYDIHCSKCGCHLWYRGNDTIYRTHEEAIKNVIEAWNRRVYERKEM